MAELKRKLHEIEQQISEQKKITAELLQIKKKMKEENIINTNQTVIQNLEDKISKLEANLEVFKFD
jgi:hypothetical protein